MKRALALAALAALAVSCEPPEDRGDRDAGKGADAAVLDAAGETADGGEADALDLPDRQLVDAVTVDSAAADDAALPRDAVAFDTVVFHPDAFIGGDLGPDTGVYDGGSASDATADGGSNLLVELQVSEPAAHARTSVPVTSGVPFSQGLLAADAELTLYTEGQQLPLQTKVLATWPDGSVRWLLLDSQLTLAAEQTRTMQLKEEMPPAIADPLLVQVEPAVITVDTGPLRVEIPRNYGGLIHRAWVDQQLIIDAPSDPIDRGAWVQRGGTSFYSSLLQNTSSPAGGDSIALYRSYIQDNGQEGGFNLFDPWDLSVTVEEAGPLRAVVRVSGALLDSSGMGFCSFVVRIHAFRGKSTLRFDHTFVFTGDEQDTIASYGVRFPFLGSTTLINGVSASTGTLLQQSYDQYSINGVAHSGQALGYLGRDNGNLSMGVVLRDMAENYPKALVATAEALEVQLYPQDVAPLDLSRYSHTIDSANGETGDNRDRGAQGLAKSDTFLLQLGSAALVESSLVAAAEKLSAGPVLALATPDWVSNSGVMGIGDFAFAPSVDSPVHYRIDRVLHILADFMRYNQRRQFLWFGLLDYGDIRGWFHGGGSGFTWHELGRYGWSGNSGEPSNQLWVQFLRKPSQQLFLDAEALARHTQDVQMVHYGDASGSGAGDWSGRNREFVVGSLHRHGRQAFSGYAGLPEYSHISGVETYYYLTGDGRAREALYEAAQFICRYGVNNPDYTALVNGVDVLSRAAAVFYDHPTHAARFTARLEVLVDYLSGGSPNPVVQELQGSNLSSSFGFFVRGAPGLMYHHARTGDPRLRSLILDAADVLVAGDGDAWNVATDGEAGSVFYHLNTLTYAAALATDATPYANLAKSAAEWNCHAAQSSGTGAISMQSLEAIPQDWRDWRWTWHEGELTAGSPELLWIDRQLTFRNDFMQDYHSYRAFVHLAVAAALLGPGEGVPR